MKNSTKTFLLCTTAAVAGMYAYNRYISETSAEKNILDDKEGSYYEWKEGRIFYKTFGNGKPLLLVHDIDSAASSIEWQKVAKKLSMNHKVYTIDLIGCGRSDKPGISYTSYLYVQMLTAFIKDVIKEKTDVIASNLSCPSVLMANQLDGDIIDQIILINPVSLKQLELMPDDLSKFKKAIINTPILGTFIYNRMTTQEKINLRFQKEFYAKSSHASATTKEAYYAAAHLDDGKGKYLFSSLLGNYMNQDIKHALKKIDRKVLILVSSEMPGAMAAVENYEKLNSQFESIHISGSNKYPQLEVPDKVLKILENAL